MKNKVKIETCFIPAFNSWQAFTKYKGVSRSERGDTPQEAEIKLRQKLSLL